MPRGPWIWTPLLLVTLLLGAGARADDPFALLEIQVSHRVVQADIADLDGDGLGDVLWTSLEGVPPGERRELRVHYQRKDRGLPDVPDWTAPMPAGVATYDLADIDGRPGAELLLLQREGLIVISFGGRTPNQRQMPVPNPPTIAATHDERGMDRLQMVSRELGAEPRLLVPGFGELTLLTPSGEVIGTPKVGSRANFFVPPPGPVLSENAVEVFFDHPRVQAGDVDGDGRADLVATGRHELRVFRQRENGGFPREPDQTLPLGRITAEDQVKNSGSVRVELGDFNDDPRIDLLVTASEGSFFDSTTEIAVHLNRAGTYDLSDPDQVIPSEGLATSQVSDLDGDGRVELVSVQLKSGILEIVEVLLTEAIDAEIEIRRRDGALPFEEDPWKSRTVDVGMNFDTFRSRGFVPNLQTDVNGDGRLDFLSSGAGEEIEIYLGDEESGFEDLAASQELDTGGRIRFGMLDPDGLSDFILYDPRRPGVPIRIGANRGSLPGTPAITPSIAAGPPGPQDSELGAPAPQPPTEAVEADAEGG